MSQPVIEVEKLQKTYRDGFLGRKRVEALKEVTFSVAGGEIFGLLGPNGAGKTTLIKVLLGIVKKTGGNASLLGRRAGDRAGRKRVGYLPENHRFPGHLTGNTAMLYYGGLSGLSPAEVRRRQGELLERVGLAEWGKTSVRKYSKGMLQRLGLAQAMLHRPDLYMLDEPTDGVDPVGRNEMRHILKELRGEGATVFINSHLLQEIELVCDRVAILVKGTLRRVGRVEEITSQERQIVVMTLVGDKATVQSALADSKVESLVLNPQGQFVATVAVSDQAQINHVLDQVRRRELDVVSLTRPKTSLEEAFLDIVQAQTVHSPSSPIPTAQPATS